MRPHQLAQDEIEDFGRLIRSRHAGAQGRK